MLAFLVEPIRTTCSLAADSPPAPPTVQLESEACWLTSATIEVLLRHNQISSMSVEAAMVAAIDSAYRKLPHAFGQMTPQRIMGLPVAQAVPISLIPLPLSAGAPAADHQGNAAAAVPAALASDLCPHRGGVALAV